MNHLLIDRDDYLETWTLNLPDSRNPITDDPMIESLVAAVDRVNGDLGVRCVVLTGAGSAFSAGGNVNDIREGRGHFGSAPFGAGEGYRHGIQRIPLALRRCEVPIIAAVNGPAIGAGCDLALACDLRIASSNAIFAESFVKLGLVPGDGGAWLLPRIVGHARAVEMTLTGDRIDAEQALAWGMVSQVVPSNELMDAARALAERISVNPPLAVRMAKRLLHEAEHQSLPSALELSAALQAIAHHTDDHREAMEAMLEKRAGTYVGS